jgi:PAS domain S-box-containing protein
MMDVLGRSSASSRDIHQAAGLQSSLQIFDQRTVWLMADFLGDRSADNSTGTTTATQSTRPQAQSGLETAQNETVLFSGESVLDILKMIFAGAPLSEVLSIIARLVESQTKGMFCTVWLLDADGKHVRCATAPSLPGFSAKWDRTPVGPNGACCGTAVYRREPVYATDILCDPLWDDYRHLLLPYGIRAVWARPLFSREGKALGTFSILYREVGSPSAAHLQLIENASHLVGIAIERTRDEAALKDSEARKAAILVSALDCIVTIDHEGRITEFNPAAERTFGYGRDEVVGRYLTDVIVPPSLREKHQRGFARYLATGQTQVLGRRIEMTAMRADGSEIPVELAITRIPLDGPPCFTGYLRDITERKRAEENLRESELKLRQMTETIPEMLWSATAEGTIDYCNARVLDYTGFPADEIMGSGWTKLLHPDDIERAAREWRSCVATGAPYRVEVRTFHAADHTYRWCVTSALPMMDQQGCVLKWHGTVVDMQDWKQAQEELRNTQAELAHVTRVMTIGQLTASIAHEINQPLSGIITNASTCMRMLAADPPSIEGALETARRTIRDGNRAAEVISRLRALFSRKAAASETLDLNEATREVIELSSGDLRRNRVILRAELDDDIPPVTGDRIQLQEVILNLLRNASDAMSSVDDRPRQLLITTERDAEDRVRLTVQDSGVGFGPQDAKKLFNAFYTTKSGGMGIGLSVSRSIIESHHGQLWAVPNEGPGATFSFSIPRLSEGVTSVRSFDAVRPLAGRAS